VRRGSQRLVIFGNAQTKLAVVLHRPISFDLAAHELPLRLIVGHGKTRRRPSAKAKFEPGF
jgi:hypothetical protein